VLVGIHKNPYGRFDDFLLKYEKILDHNGIDHVRLEASESNFWEIIPNLDLFIFHWGHLDAFKDRAKAILPVIENHYHIPCLPNQATCWHYDDKIKQFYLFKKYGFPVAESWVFWEKPDALAWAKKAEYPVLFKLTGGAGSSNVVKIDSMQQAEKLVNKMFGPGIKSGRIPISDSLSIRKQIDLSVLLGSAKSLAKKLLNKGESPFWRIHKNYAYFQKFYPDNAFDTRVTTIGGSVYAFRRFTRTNDYRASGSDHWDKSRDKIDENLLKLSLQISQTLDFQVMAYDWIYDEQKQPRLIEISYCYGDYPEFSDGFWDSELNWHEGDFTTQYLELKIALNMPELKNLPLPPTGHYAKVGF
jgi:glutathione synthase/RimK-type ligase-like ATP-grasp enzyme